MSHIFSKWAKPENWIGIVYIWIIVFFMVYSGWMPETLAKGKPDTSQPIDFTDLSLEELKDVEIVTVSKKPERLVNVAAAVFVITREDIRRSGVTTIPDALRLAPGVQVARISTTDWAVNIRGLNERFSNNLLVLIDGRTVYSPVFSGVFWDVQDTLIEDIERIEVIRGPGAAVWGSNAVNGVINIITRKAKHTVGGHATLLTGTEEDGAGIRYGDQMGDCTWYRIYTKYSKKNDLAENTDEAPDATTQNPPSRDWRSVRGGFRIDHEPSDKGPGTHMFTIQGEAYNNRNETEVERISLLPPRTSVESDLARSSGGHLLARWNYILSKTSDTEVQFYYDGAKTNYETFSTQVTTLDLDFQHRFNFFKGHEMSWGFGYRLVTDDINNSFEIAMEPDREHTHGFSAFFQDEMVLDPDRVWMTLGAKLEYNKYTELEIQPSLRLLWTPARRHAFWGSISRAVRVPSRMELDVQTNEQVVEPMDDTDLYEALNRTWNLESNAPIVVRNFGNHDLDSEKLMAYEVGYRFLPFDGMWVNSTIFYNDYSKLIELSPGQPWFVNGDHPYWVSPWVYGNTTRGETYGGEISADWQVTHRYRIRANYTYLKAHIDRNYEQDWPWEDHMGTHPRNQFSLLTSIDIVKGLELDVWLRYVDRLSENKVNSYNTMDIRVGWQPLENLSISFVGQNLFDSGHSEFSIFEVERSAYIKLDWRF